MSSIGSTRGSSAAGLYGSQVGQRPVRAAVAEFVGTAILVFVIFALTTATNNPPMSNLGPVVVGLLVVGIGMAWGANAGYAINPARDFGPRVASLITGYSDALSDQNGDLYFWLPIVAPILGGLLGGAAFKYLIERYLPVDGEEPTVSEPVQNA